MRDATEADLPRLVKQRYSQELRKDTLASIRSEVSSTLDSLLEELNSGESGKISHASGYPPNPQRDCRPVSPLCLSEPLPPILPGHPRVGRGLLAHCVLRQAVRLATS